MKIAGLDFPDNCPENCPDIKNWERFEQGNTCSRCPIFNCREFEYMGGKARMLEPEQYPEDIAKAWHKWFKSYGVI
jgi:hypothetical protein